MELRYNDTWSFDLLKHAPSTRLPEDYYVPSISHTESDVVEADRALEQPTYDFQRAKNWTDVVLQVLASISWRADCVWIADTNTDRLPPPAMAKGRQILVGIVVLDRWATK